MSLIALAIVLALVIVAVWFMNTQLSVPPGLKTGGNIAVFLIILIVVIALLLRLLGIPVSTRVG